MQNSSKNAHAPRCKNVANRASEVHPVCVKIHHSSQAPPTPKKVRMGRRLPVINKSISVARGAVVAMHLVGGC